MQGIRQNEPHRHHQYLHRQSDVGDERQPPSVPENDLGFLPRLLRCCSHLEIQSFLQKTEAGDFLSGHPPQKGVKHLSATESNIEGPAGILFESMNDGYNEYYVFEMKMLIDLLANTI